MNYVWLLLVATTAVPDVFCRSIYLGGVNGRMRQTESDGLMEHHVGKYNFRPFPVVIKSSPIEKFHIKTPEFFNDFHLHRHVKPDGAVDYHVDKFTFKPPMFTDSVFKHNSLYSLPTDKRYDKPIYSKDKLYSVYNDEPSKPQFVKVNGKDKFVKDFYPEKHSVKQDIFKEKIWRKPQNKKQKFGNSYEKHDQITDAEAIYTDGGDFRQGDISLEVYKKLLNESFGGYSKNKQITQYVDSIPHQTNLDSVKNPVLSAADSHFEGDHSSETLYSPSNFQHNEKSFQKEPLFEDQMAHSPRFSPEHRHDQFQPPIYDARPQFEKEWPPSNHLAKGPEVSDKQWSGINEPKRNPSPGINYQMFGVEDAIRYNPDYQGKVGMGTISAFGNYYQVAPQLNSHTVPTAAKNHAPVDNVPFESEKKPIVVPEPPAPVNLNTHNYGHDMDTAMSEHFNYPFKDNHQFATYNENHYSGMNQDQHNQYEYKPSVHKKQLQKSTHDGMTAVVINPNAAPELPTYQSHDGPFQKELDSSAYEGGKNTGFPSEASNNGHFHPNPMDTKHSDYIKRMEEIGRSDVIVNGHQAPFTPRRRKVKGKRKGMAKYHHKAADSGSQRHHWKGFGEIHIRGSEAGKDQAKDFSNTPSDHWDNIQERDHQEHTESPFNNFKDAGNSFHSKENGVKGSDMSNEAIYRGAFDDSQEVLPRNEGAHQEQLPSWFPPEGVGHIAKNIKWPLAL